MSPCAQFTRRAPLCVLVLAFDTRDRSCGKADGSSAVREGVRRVCGTEKSVLFACDGMSDTEIGYAEGVRWEMRCRGGVRWDMRWDMRC
eukprot:1695318-Rhodomonas_salina.1